MQGLISWQAHTGAKPFVRMLQVQVRFGIRAPSLLIRVFLNEVLLIVAGSHESGHKMSSNVFPKNYISKNTDVLHMFFLRKNSPYQQLSSLNDGTHLQSSDIWEVKDQGWTHCHAKLLSQRWVYVPGSENSSCRSFTGSNWSTLGAVQPLLGQHTGQRHTGKTSCLHSIRKGNKGKQWKVWNSKLGPGLSIPASMKGLSTSSSPSSASGVRNGQSCYDFFCRPAPPPATQCLSQASKARAIASATSFMTVFLDAKSFWCAEDWRYWNSLILSFSSFSRI